MDVRHCATGLKWSDGQPLTSEDVAFTYRFVIDNKIPQYKSYFPANPTFTTPMTDDARLDGRRADLRADDAARGSTSCPSTSGRQYDGK